MHVLTTRGLRYLTKCLFYFILLYASGACCPEDILRVPVEDGGVQILEVLG